VAHHKLQAVDPLDGVALQIDVCCLIEKLEMVNLCDAEAV